MSYKDIWIEDVDYRVDSNGCWIWLRHFSRSGTPIYSAALTARRYIWIQRGYKVDRKTRMTVTCGQPKCVNPAHLKRSTVSGVMRGSVCSVLSEADMEEIEVDIRCAITAREIAAKYGISYHYARNVRAKVAAQIAARNKRKADKEPTQ